MTREERQLLAEAMAMNDTDLVAALQKPFVDSTGEEWVWPVGIAAAKRIAELRGDADRRWYNTQFLRRDGLLEAARLMENAFGDKHAGKAIRALWRGPQ